METMTTDELLEENIRLLRDNAELKRLNELYSIENADLRLTIKSDDAEVNRLRANVGQLRKSLEHRIHQGMIAQETLRANAHAYVGGDEFVAEVIHADIPLHEKLSAWFSVPRVPKDQVESNTMARLAQAMASLARAVKELADLKERSTELHAEAYRLYLGICQAYSVVNDARKDLSPLHPVRVALESTYNQLGGLIRDTRHCGSSWHV